MFKENTPRMSRRDALIVAGFAAVIVYAIWNISALSFVVYPFRLFVTYVHEAGHSAMALLTGGEVIGFRIFSDGSGVATTRGGTRSLILPAGYLGAATFGAVLFYLVNMLRASKSIAIILGIGLIVFSVLYAVPSDGFPLALFIGMGFGAILIALGWKASSSAVFFVLNVLAIMTALNAVLDLFSLTRFADISATTQGNAVRNDALAFHDEVASFLPASVWAFLWAGIAVLLVGAAFYYSIVRPVVNQAGEKINNRQSILGSLDPRPKKKD